jgi:hypothetical protein
MDDNGNLGYSLLTTMVFSFVAIVFLFPSSSLFPLDRKLTGLLGSTLIAGISRLYQETGSLLDYVDVQVRIY